MNAELELMKIRAEQMQCATLLLAGHPDQRGLRQGLSDLMCEDLILSGLWSEE